MSCPVSAKGRDVVMDLNIRNVPEDVVRDAKVKALEEGVSLREWVIILLRASLSFNLKTLEKGK